MRLYEFDAKKQAEEDFEKVLFGDLKKDSEKDTAFEYKIFMSVYNFIRDANNITKEKALKSLMYLDKFKEIFPDDLIPKSRTVYRGTNISIDALMSLFDNAKINKKGVVELDSFTYKQKVKFNHGLITLILAKHSMVKKRKRE